MKNKFLFVVLKVKNLVDNITLKNELTIETMNTIIVFESEEKTLLRET